MSARSAHRKMREILEFVRAHPGCNTEDIDAVGKKSVLDSALLQLSIAGLVENREDPDVPPRWYPIEVPAQPRYVTLADKLLEELDKLHDDQQSAYLAKRLEELMG
jgi:hypothetical protein